LRHEVNRGGNFVVILDHFSGEAQLTPRDHFVLHAGDPFFGWIKTPYQIYYY